ncbi:hypothetical protein DRP77_07950 [Candidatus Poribacteria bacterium]|nr:MAG: hypothetical protein DRP77_07950 [Candidatus Poribacteria bacterium]
MSREEHLELIAVFKQRLDDMNAMMAEISRKLDGVVNKLEEIERWLARMEFRSEDITDEEWYRAAAANPAFEFLKDPEEDIYSSDDGRPFRDRYQASQAI